MESENSNKWPKVLPNLTEEQKRIKDDFMHCWLDVLPKKFGIVEVFNHNYPKRMFRYDVKRKDHWNTLELGGGVGSHIPFEDMSIQDYTVLELRQNIMDTLRKRYPNVRGILGDMQGEYAEADSYDRIIAIHVLEHLPNLPEAVKQMHRVLKSDGVAHIVIPCEGSLAYSICRKISAERLFKKTYNMDYGWFIKSEHINLPYEITEELEKFFIIKKKWYFPIPVPFEFCNVCIGMTLYPKEEIKSIGC